MANKVHQYEFNKHLRTIPIPETFEIPAFFDRPPEEVGGMLTPAARRILQRLFEPGFTADYELRPYQYAPPVPNVYDVAMGMPSSPAQQGGGVRREQIQGGGAGPQKVGGQGQASGLISGMQLLQEKMPAEYGYTQAVRPLNISAQTIKRLKQEGAYEAMRAYLTTIGLSPETYMGASTQAMPPAEKGREARWSVKRQRR